MSASVVNVDNMKIDSDSDIIIITAYTTNNVQMVVLFNTSSVSSSKIEIFD